MNKPLDIVAREFKSEFQRLDLKYGTHERGFEGRTKIEALCNMAQRIATAFNLEGAARQEFLIACDLYKA